MRINKFIETILKVSTQSVHYFSEKLRLLNFMSLKKPMFFLIADSTKKYQTLLLLSKFLWKKCLYMYTIEIYL